ncbi:MAG: type II toxin-antitoxin system Phd/YefM family antitoxin [Anaerolineae bacterium]
MAQVTVGIRELKARLSSYVRKARSGASVIITDRGEPVARLVPMGRSLEDRMEDLVYAGLITWSGKKLSRLAPVARTQGQQTVADLLLEDRE